MDQTPNLELPFIMAAQAQKHITHNEALRILDALVQLSVVARDLATPPGGQPLHRGRGAPAPVRPDLTKSPPGRTSMGLLSPHPVAGRCRVQDEAKRRRMRPLGLGAGGRG